MRVSEPGEGGKPAKGHTMEWITTVGQEPEPCSSGVFCSAVSNASVIGQGLGEESTHVLTPIFSGKG